MNDICRAADICDEVKRGFVALSIILEVYTAPEADGLRYVIDNLINTTDKLGDILDNALAEEREKTE